MSKRFRNSTLAKVVSGFTGVLMSVMMLGGLAVAPAQAQTVADLMAMIAQLQAQLNALSGGTTTGTGYTFAVNLKQGMTGTDVMNLQKVLNMDPATQIAQGTDAGAPGYETSYFGARTKAAVIKFQDKYTAAILTPVGLTAGTGFVGASTRAKLNSMTVGTGTGTGTGTTPTPGTGVSIAAATQPANSLAPQSAARVPFTKFTVTAGSDGSVVLNGVTVERTGLGANAAFSGIILLDQDGVQLGTVKTLNSNNQAVVGEAVTIPAGQTRTFTVAGNMAADNSTRAGQLVSLSVVAVNTSAAVSGSLPITGASHTINATLSIGSATFNVSSFDPNTAQTKEIGTTGVRLAGIRVTAGSAEDIRLKNIRWNNTGSAGSGDIANVVVVVGTTEYPATVSADGKFYTANFGSGVLVAKGNNIDVYAKADIIGGPDRTVFFDIDKATDIYVTGETYGYGITGTAASTATASDTSSEFTTGTPFFDASKLTISAGSATTIQKSSTVAAQNIAVNVPNQPLGAFETNIKGEAINISGMTLTVATSSGFAIGDLTSVTIVDQNGTVVAGPVDANTTNTSIVFTDSITIPVGKMVYSVKGKIEAGATNGGTYTLTVTPSGWTSPTGNVTGNAITISQGAFALNTMTVRAAALAVTVSSTPGAQNLTAGAQGVTFANYQFDATQSGEDVRFSSMVGLLGGGSDASEGPYNDLSSCQLFDGSTALNEGGNIVNPSAGTASTTSTNTFTFDNALTVTKGTIKTVALKCNVSSSAATLSTYQWGIANTAANIIVTGVTSSGAVTETVTASNGQLMTVAGVTVVASKDSSSPSYAIASAGSTGVTAGVIKFRAANEAVTLQRVGLKLTNTASSSAGDLVQVSLWDGTTQVGTATFTGGNTNATSTLTTTVTLPKDVDKKLTVKVDLADIGAAQTGTQGHLIAVDIDTNGTNTQGVGQESGTTVNASGSTAFSGVRMFRSFPTFAKLALTTTSLTTSTMDLYRFSVKADAKGDVGIYKFTVNVATSSTPSGTSTTTVTNLKIMAYTDSGFSNAVSGFSPAGQLNDTAAGLVSSGNNNVLMTASTQGEDYLQIPAGQTYYFRVVGDVTLTGGPTGGSVTTNIQGDSAYPTTNVYVTNGGTGFMASSTGIDTDSEDDFIWSPNATTTSATTVTDWTNGYFVTGLPSDNMDNSVLVK